MRRVLLLLAVLSLGLAPLPFPKPAKPLTEESELKALRGAWGLISYTLQGRPPVRQPGEETVVFDGNRQSRATGGKTVARWVVTLDPSKSPKQMDLHDPDAPGESIVGIYRLDGDTLTFAYRNSVNALERPTDFRPHVLMGVQVFQRKKP